MNTRLLAIFQTITILFMMSVGTVLMKIVLFDINPFTFAWTSIGVGMIVMSVFTFIIKKERIPNLLGKKVWFYIIAIGLCNFTISKLTRPMAIQRLPVITASYVGNFIGFLTMVMSVFILKEVPSLFQILGAGVAIGGLTVYFNAPLQSAETIGVLIILAGILAVAFTNNIARKLSIETNGEVSNNVVSTVALLIGGIIPLTVGLIFDFPPRVPDLRSWGIILYTGVINISLGLTAWNYILRTLRSFEASILGASTIIYTTILAMLLLGERPTPNQWLGIILLIIGLILVQIRKGKINLIYQGILTRLPNKNIEFYRETTKQE